MAVAVVSSSRLLAWKDICSVFTSSWFPMDAASLFSLSIRSRFAEAVM